MIHILTSRNSVLSKTVSKNENSRISIEFFHSLQKYSTLFLPWAKINSGDGLTIATNSNIPETKIVVKNGIFQTG